MRYTIKWNNSIKNHEFLQNNCQQHQQNKNSSKSNSLTSNRIHSSPIQIIRLRPLHDPIDLLAGIADCQQRPIQIADGTSLPAFHFEKPLEGSQVFLFHFGWRRRRGWRCWGWRWRCCGWRRGEGLKAAGIIVVIEEGGPRGGKADERRTIQRFAIFMRGKWWGAVEERHDSRGRKEPLKGKCGSHGLDDIRQRPDIVSSTILFWCEQCLFVVINASRKVNTIVGIIHAIPGGQDSNLDQWSACGGT